ncbi:CBS domain-containing protein [Kaistia dalseonensis]|uniref:CBS domain-containing protein n=1 Tax=Kaistia dalseonensis TaxID=410840 RepID=A0ABU0HCJ0_9HYPH|nr:CBS domain-containing protein [Kaistia dalseonensis]MCX5497391.1 CBS domain-containing protein [Kaistia dalseonensis]MDQ0440030.1 CBS domain-containing protein [Kaistia dalseonensis]
MQARDIMSHPLITVSPTTSVLEIAELLLQKKISAVAVVDDKGRLVGIVSEANLMPRAEPIDDKPDPWWLRWFVSKEQLADDYARRHGQTAADIMTRYVVRIRPEATVPEIVAQLTGWGIKRAIVCEGEKPVGIVSRADILRALVASESGRKANETDREIRARLVEELKDQPWFSIGEYNVVVIEGVVHYWGPVGSEAERNALKIAAMNVPGVVSVEDHTHAKEPFEALVD